MKVPRRLIAIAERMSTVLMPAVVLPTDPARQPTAKTAIPEADEAPSTAESMRSIGDADLEARGWNEGPDSTFDRGFSLWDADDTPDALPDDHPDRSNGAEAPTTLDPAGPAIEVKEEPEPTSFWTRAAVFQASLALLGLFFVTAPTGLTLGLQALDDARDPCRAAAEPIAAHEADRAALLVEKIWAAPDTTTCLLSSHGMDRDSFLGLMDDIASDRVLARSFEDARAAVRATADLRTP